MRAQEQALVTDGRFNFGRYSQPFKRLNPLDVQGAFGVPLPRAALSMRLKEWQAFQMATPRFFVNVALFNAKALALVQVKVFDRQLRRKHLYERKVTPWAFVGVSDVLDSRMEWRGEGAAVVFTNQLAQDRVQIHIDLPETPGCPRIHGGVTALWEGVEPLVVALPFAERRGMYSHKGVTPATGALQIGDEVMRFGPGEGYVLMDDHRGFYPYVMRWDWLTSACWREDGVLVGFNLTRNQALDPERNHENALWVDGRRYDLPAVRFERQGERWTIRDAQGQVDLTFTVEVPGPVDINAVVLRSRYQGPFGVIHGAITDSAGTRHAIEGWFGMGEEFYLRC